MRVLMHFDVFLRYLTGTGMYFNCFGNFEIHVEFVGSLERAQNWAFMQFLPQGMFEVPIKQSNASNCFLKVQGEREWMNEWMYFFLETESLWEQHLRHLRSSLRLSVYMSVLSYLIRYIWFWLLLAFDCCCCCCLCFLCRCCCLAFVIAPSP